MQRRRKVHPSVRGGSSRPSTSRRRWRVIATLGMNGRRRPGCAVLSRPSPVAAAALQSSTNVADERGPIACSAAANRSWTARGGRARARPFRDGDRARGWRSGPWPASRTV